MSTILVTGASRGIGAATARALSDRDLVLVGRDTDALDSVARDCRSARVVTADLTTADGIAAAAAGIDTLDGLVHCAGVAGLGRVDESDAEQWRHQYEVNVVAVVELTRVLLPALRAARGDVVVVNSGAGTTAKPGWGAYSASKFALRAFTDTLRGEEPDLRVTSVHPGRVDTDMQRGIVASEGRTYTPDAYLRAESVATVIRQALEATADAHIAEVAIRPRPR
ncbi:MAG TPA: SDR family oxidoreductase [Candidatus Dietzia intestinigallinarum]|nr:SDR family oxidoreductase [Candidatus Dietzia intestinigallinarum]